MRDRIWVGDLVKVRIRDSARVILVRLKGLVSDSKVWFKD